MSGSLLIPFDKLTHRHRATIADMWWKRLDTYEIATRLHIAEADVCRIIARQQQVRRDSLMASRRA